MSVNVTVPVPEDYREAATAGSSLFTIANAGDYIIGYEQSSPSKLVRFTKADLETQSVFTFPADGKHVSATGIYYRQSTGRAYVTFFRPGWLVVSEVNTLTTPMTSTIVLDRALTGSMAPTWIDGDETYIYVLSRMVGSGVFSKIALSDFSETTLALSAFFLGSQFCVSNGKAYLPETTALDSTQLELLKIDLTSLTTEGAGIFPITLVSHPSIGPDIIPSSSEIWVSFRDHPASVYRFTSSLDVTAVATTAEGDHTGFGYDGSFFWQLFSSGVSLRLDPSNVADTRRYVLSTGYMSELIPADQYLYVLQNSEIARYRIPTGDTPGTVLLSDCSITGKAVAVDRSPLSTAGTIIVGKDSTPFYVYKYSAVPGVPNDSCVLGSRTLQLLPGWPKLIGETVSGFFQSNGYAKGVAVDSLGNIIACAGQGINENPRATVFIVKLTPDGTTLWQKHNGLATDGAADAKSVCVDSENNVIVVGNFWGTVNFGGGNITATSGNDVFIAKYSPTGTLIFPVKVFVPSGTAPAVAVGVDGSNNIYVMGQMSGTINFGGATLNAVASNIPFLVKFASNGTHTMSRVFAGGAQASIGGMAVNSAGIITFCGNFFNTFDIGGGPMVSPFPGAPTGFVAQYNAAGASSAHRWSKSMADADSACTALGCAMDAIGNAILTGSLSGSFDFGAATLTAVYNRDLYVAKYGPTGINLWALGRSGGPFSIDFGNSVACFSNGDVAATGTVLVAKIAG